jgi:hypothetical protein
MIVISGIFIQLNLWSIKLTVQRRCCFAFSCLSAVYDSGWSQAKARQSASTQRETEGAELLLPRGTHCRRVKYVIGCKVNFVRTKEMLDSTLNANFI